MSQSSGTVATASRRAEFSDALARAAALLETGRFVAAASLYEHVRRDARHAGEGALALAAELGIGEAAFERRDLVDARHAAETCFFDGREAQDAELSARGALLLARVVAAEGTTGAEGNVELALVRCADAAAQLALAPKSRWRALPSIEGAAILVDRGAAGDASAALARLHEARSLIAEDDGIGAALSTRLHFELARARALAGDVAGALASVDSLIASGAISHDRPLLAWRAFAWVAECRAASGAAPAARHAREQALALLEEMALELPPQQRALFWSDPQKQRIKASGESQRRRTETAVVSDEKETHMKTGRLLELIRRLALELDMNRLLERITDAAVEISGAERGFVLTVGAAGKLETHTVRTAGDAEHDPHVLFSQSIAEAVLIDGEPIITVDARSDSRVTEFLSVHKLSLKSVACLPIRGRAGVVGVLYLEHRVRRGRFEEADMGLLFAFADQAAIAIENAKQFAERAARQSELERVNRALEEAMRELERTVDARTSELETAHQELSRVKRELGSASGMHGIVGRSAPMRRVFSLVDRVAPTHVPVVIFGESGTGKELVARAIHDASPRAQRPFVAINCGSVPESLIESELFGHVRGAFTGADRDRPGVFVQASGGTLFLDEIGDMPPKMQVDLLRVLQEGKVRPVGSQAEIAVDVRVVCASNQALGALVEAKRFREDLFYRLNVVQIDLPPLRERKEDIALLADHLLEKVAKRTGTPLRRLDRSALERLVAASLPGNVRQLEHALTGAAVLASGDTIRADDLSLEGLSPATRPGVRAPSSAGTSVAPPQSVRDHKSDERQRILDALESYSWNRARAAQALGIPRRTFYRRLREFGILDTAEGETE